MIDSELFVTEYVSRITSMQYPGIYVGLLVQNYNPLQLYGIVEYLYESINREYKLRNPKPISDDMMISLIDYNIYLIVSFMQQHEDEINWYLIHESIEDIVENHIGINLQPYEEHSW